MAGTTVRRWHMQRYGQIIGVKPEHIAQYEELHEQVWPEVLATIHACNIRNYTIFRHGTLLFAYFEYIGDDFAADPKTREWWSHTDPLQEPVADRAEGEWWTTMRPVFHTD
jgi:L-rhamnose mutarotase